MNLSTILHQPQFHIFLFFILVLIPVIAALACLYYSFSYLKASWILRETPASKIRSAAQGYNELTGAGQYFNEQHLTATLTKTPCIWFHYAIDQWQTRETSEGLENVWITIEEGKSKDPFMIADKTGECLIFPEKAAILTIRSNIWMGYQRMPNPMKPKQGFISALGSWLFEDRSLKFRYREYRLENDEIIYATGFFKTLSIDDPFIQDNVQLKRYLEQKGQKFLNILTDEGLPQKYEFVVSNFKESILAKQFQRQALIYFIAFLFFSAVSTSSIYSLVMQALANY